MSLFKALRGNSEQLPSQFHDGYAYLCTDNEKLYIDATDSEGEEKRILINPNAPKVVTGILAAFSKSLTLSFIGTCIATSSRDSDGNDVVLNVVNDENSVTFESSQNVSSPITCTAIYV